MNPGEVFSHLEVERRGASADLVVLLHAINSGPDDLADLRQVIERADDGKAFADADLLAPQMRAGVLANTDIYLVASQLEDWIDELFRERQETGAGYRKIYLIGHSIGALVLRKCLVWGFGSTEDHPLYQAPSSPKPWVARVDRVILLAGVNRGWSLSPRPRHMPRYEQLLRALASAAAGLVGVGGLIRSVARGAPFVADLRVQWVRLARARGDELPPVIQLLGDVDDVVDREDNKDALVATNFLFVPVPGTDHRSIRQFDDSQYGRTRRRRFSQALLDSPQALRERWGEIGHSLREQQEVATGADDRRVVFVMHGIRDYGHWRQKVEEQIRKLDPEAVVVTSSYGWFPMARFLLGRDRQRNVRWFMDQYTEMLARFPRARFSFFGHSNGTYLLASALRRYATMEFQRVAFAGSVVPRSFPWRKYLRADGSGRVTALRNDMGDRDVVVGIFPRLFELFNEIFRQGLPSDIGSAGFNGFADDVADELQAYLPGGHGAGTKESNHEPVARFLIKGENRYAEDRRNGPLGWASWLSRLCWVVWVLIGLGLVWIGYAVFDAHGAAAAAAYALAVLGVLYTV